MSLIARTAHIACKDLLVCLRTPGSIASVYVLGVLIVVVPALGLGPGGFATGIGKSAGATAILWTAYLFAGVMCFERTMRVEAFDGAIDALRMSPVPSGVLFLGKFLANLLILVLLACVISLAGVVLLRVDLSEGLGAYAGVTALGLVGIAAVGTLFSAGLCTTGVRGDLLGLLSMPLLLPMVLLSSRVLEQLAENPAQAGETPWKLVGAMIAADVLYLTVGWVGFEVALEE